MFYCFIRAGTTAAIMLFFCVTLINIISDNKVRLLSGYINERLWGNTQENPCLLQYLIWIYTVWYPLCDILAIAVTVHSKSFGSPQTPCLYLLFLNWYGSFNLERPWIQFSWKKAFIIFFCSSFSTLQCFANVGRLNDVKNVNQSSSSLVLQI